MRQPIGSRIQLAIRQRHLALHHRDGRGITRDLRLEQLVHTRIARIIRLRCIPLHQYLFALCLAQQRQTIHRHILGALGQHRRQQMPPMAHPPLQRRMLEQRRGIGQTAHDPLFAFGQRQRQVELRARLRRTQTTGLEFAKIQLTLRRVLPREHHLEQRRMCKTARRLHQFHHLLERDVLMRLRLQRTFFHRRQQLRQRR